MSVASERFFDYGTPQGLTTPSIVQASSLTTAPVAIPAEWYGLFVEFTFSGAAARDKLCIRFGTTSANSAVALATASTNAGASTYAITAAGTEPMLVLFDGATARRRLDRSWLFFNHISNTASGFLYASLVSGRSPLG